MQFMWDNYVELYAKIRVTPPPPVQHNPTTNHQKRNLIHTTDWSSPDYTPEKDIQIFLIPSEVQGGKNSRNMDHKNSPMEGGQPLLPLQDPPEYSSHGFPPSEIYPSTSGRPAQQYGAPAALGQCIQGPYPGQTVVTVQPPVNMSFTPLTNPLPDHLCYSIFTMLCCCLPLGSAALVYSITTRDANTFGHQPIASRNSRMARILNHVSVGVGLLVWLIFVIYFVLVFIAVSRF
ncbi:Synapse differentiation-inducing gene protein 1-like [Anabarilius grahami]|uniref:Synapse differentiation-inducing gene protein 1-like n=1 Tax=Anabarilius grahami TaxID=495550 RepID=A0A3N0Y5D1_ANAGA|nr:Synapse differentiation-inducing gene protein 1-like [Anabarilius grahami]